MGKGNGQDVDGMLRALVARYVTETDSDVQDWDGVFDEWDIGSFERAEDVLTHYATNGDGRARDAARTLLTFIRAEVWADGRQAGKGARTMEGIAGTVEGAVEQFETWKSEVREAGRKDVRRAGTLYAFRASPNEAAILIDALNLSRLTPSEFMRRAALEYAARYARGPEAGA